MTSVNEFDKLIPNLSEAERNDIIAYRKVYEPQVERIRQESKKNFENHPIFGPLLKSIPEDLQNKMNEHSRKLENDAIYNNNWGPYTQNLIQQGIQYAHMGFDLRAWYEILTMARGYIEPIIEQEFAKDLKNGAAANRGMNRFFDIGMRVIGESFIHERNRLIETQKSHQDKLIKELESFAYIISHDLKTPLRGIASLAEWLSVEIKIENTLPNVSTFKVPTSQVFANLITNAIKHNDKTEIKISIGSEDDKEFWEFHITDNGPGIEKEFHEKVFQIFQTLKTKDEANSTGIGLSVVKKIIENTGGKIWIESEKEKGTTFYFTIKK